MICKVDNAGDATYYRVDSQEGGMFSMKYGNAGTLMFKRSILLEDDSIGFPESTIEDLRFVDLASDLTTLKNFRQRQYKHILLTGN